MNILIFEMIVVCKINNLSFIIIRQGPQDESTERAQKHFPMNTLKRWKRSQAMSIPVTLTCMLVALIAGLLVGIFLGRPRR
jgi:hypothetical protein